MKKLLYVAFCLTVAMSLGCIAITWPCITDNDLQSEALVNTNGKAHLFETSQTGLLTGGKMYTHASFVDQTAGGMQKLTVYEMEGMPYQFHTDTYCNPDWTGCAWFTYDYACYPFPACTFYGPGAKLNLNCFLTSAVGLCNYVRYGECGRSLRMPNMQWSEIDQLMNSAVENGNILTFNINRGNTSVTFQNGTGQLASWGLVGNQELNLDLNHGRATIQAGTSYANSMRKLSQIVDQGFQNGLMTITRNGVSKSLQVQFFSGTHMRESLNRLGL